MSDIEEARLAVAAAKRTGLPVIASFAFDSGRNKDRTMMGATPEAVAAAMVEAGADAVGANCGVGVEYAAAICRAPARGLRSPDLDQAERRPAEDGGRRRSATTFPPSSLPATTPPYATPALLSWAAAVAPRRISSAPWWRPDAPQADQLRGPVPRNVRTPARIPRTRWTWSFCPRGSTTWAANRWPRRFRRWWTARPKASTTRSCSVTGCAAMASTGLTARHTQLILPRAHDCIALLMGSRDRYLRRTSRQSRHVLPLHRLARARQGPPAT